MVRLGDLLGPVIPTAWAMLGPFDAISRLSGQSCVNLGAILDHPKANRRLENCDFTREVYQNEDADEYVLLLFYLLLSQPC